MYDTYFKYTSIENHDMVRVSTNHHQDFDEYN